MADYNIVKHCRWCRKRFVVNKTEAKKNFCDNCQSKVKNQQNDSEGGTK
jgi:rRNA maturation endonuclease Nob1